MQNLNKHFKTLDELIQECIKMSPLVDIKDNVVYLKHVISSKNYFPFSLSIDLYRVHCNLKPLNCSRVTAQNFCSRFQELEQQNRHKTGSGFSEEFEVNIA